MLDPQSARLPEGNVATSRGTGGQAFFDNRRAQTRKGRRGGGPPAVTRPQRGEKEDKREIKNPLR